MTDKYYNNAELFFRHHTDWVYGDNMDWVYGHDMNLFSPSLTRLMDNNKRRLFMHMEFINGNSNSKTYNKVPFNQTKIINNQKINPIQHSKSRCDLTNVQNSVPTNLYKNINRPTPPSTNLRTVIPAETNIRYPKLSKNQKVDEDEEKSNSSSNDDDCIIVSNTSKIWEEINLLWEKSNGMSKINKPRYSKAKGPNKSQ